MNDNTILIVENRRKHLAIISLNVQMYLGTTPSTCQSLDGLEEFINNQNPKLIIARDEMDGKHLKDLIGKLLKAYQKNCSVIILGHEESTKDGITVIQDNLEMRPLLKTAADLLEITPEMMTKVDVPENFPITSSLFRELLHFPCDVFRKVGEEYELLFNKDSDINKNVWEGELKKNTIVYINALERLKFCNSFTEQISKLALDLLDPNISLKERIKALNKTVDIIAEKMIVSGVDQEVSNLAKTTVKAMLQVSEENTVVTELLKKLISDENSFRYKHAQIILFIGMQVIHELKAKLGSDEYSIEAFGYAALFHDIVLENDKHCKVRCDQDISLLKIEKEEKSKLINHAGEGALLVSKLSDAPKGARDIIREHHGRTNGDGFSTYLKGISNISKVFVIVEHWTHLILEDPDCLKDDALHFKIFKSLYNGEIEEKIIKVLFKFNREEIIKGVTDDLSELSQIIQGTFLEKFDDIVISGTTDNVTEENTLVKGQKENLTEDTAMISGSVEEPNDEIVAKFGTEKIDTNEEFGSYKVDGVEDPGSMQVKSLGGDTDELRGAFDQAFTGFCKDDPELGKEWEETKSLVAAFQENKEVQSSFNHELESIYEDDVKDKKPDKAAVLAIKRKIQEVKNKLNEQLKEQEFDPNERGKEGRTKLMIAALSGNDELVDLLISKGADSKLQDYTGKTALHFAAISGSDEALKKLIEAGCNINKQDEKRRTPLFMAIQSNHHQLAVTLISKEARVNIKAEGGVTLPMLAAFNGNLMLLETLDLHGAPLNTKDDKGKDIADYAKMKKQEDVLKYIAEKKVVFK